MIGIDIVKIDRISSIAGSDRIFSFDEILYAEKFKNKLEHYAGFFACKEALYKAVNADKQSLIKFNEISIIHNEKGAPMFEFLGQTSRALENEEYAVSLSHDGDYAVAYVIKKI